MPISENKNFIDGIWVPSKDSGTYLIRNPADKKTILGKYQSSTLVDMEHAIRSASKTLPNWANIPAPQRSTFLFRALAILTARAE